LLIDAYALAFKKTFFTQFVNINIRSRELPNVLTHTLTFRENVNVNTSMSLQGDDVITLVEILDQVSL
jgi:hypothetical protein